MASKYDSIREHLLNTKETSKTLSYSEINELIGKLYPREFLPPHSYDNKAWWSNDQTSHTQSKSWLSAGWKTDMSKSELGKFIVFIRNRK